MISNQFFIILILGPFLDDLFDDDDDNKKPINKDQKDKEDEGNKRKYLDQKWKLNAEDAKDFKGFSKNDDNKIKSDNAEAATQVSHSSYIIYPSTQFTHH